ncbi:glycosyltransferase family 2 protein [Glaciecola sp. SC05]|uniref:glycosyltransferase family 2 protein n=1 Tax=Glaciecola sp. SC05 TaxID=1987355 RepID=UPI0035282883
MSQIQSISVVIPAKNEADNIQPLVSEIFLYLSEAYDFEIIYVDDGSTDDTAHKVMQLVNEFPNKIRLLQHKKSVGQSTAIYSGVANAKGGVIITLDADGQNNPKDIPKLLKRAASFKHGSDYCITGFRKARKDTAWKRLQSRVANNVRAALLKDDTPDTGCGLKVFPRATFLKLPYFDHMHRYLPALIKRLGGSIEVVEVSHRDRQHGVSKYGMWGRLFAGLIDMLGVMWLQRRTKIPHIQEPKIDGQ